MPGPEPSRAVPRRPGRETLGRPSQGMLGTIARVPPSHRLPLVAMIILLLAACGDGAATSRPPVPTPSPTAPTTSQPSTATPAAPSPTPSPRLSPTASSAPVGGGPTGDPPSLDLVEVASGLDAPLDIATRPADATSMLLAEQGGRLRVIRDGSLSETPFLDISAAVQAGGEQGLLGVAVHPDPADGRVVVYYTDRMGSQIVSTFSARDGDPDRAYPASEVRLLEMADEFGNHNGGGLQFGPDGYLYISTGDGGGGGDPLDSGRRLDTLLAKVLRIDIDAPGPGDLPYGIPSDNPFVGVEGARPEIWATGLRNPWRMRFDAATGDLWIGDVGQGEREEIDLAPAGVGGLDFGWNIMEGTACYRSDECEQEGLTLPIAEYGHDEGCSVTGGTVYRGAAQPALVGWYVLSDYCSGRFWLLDSTAGSGQTPIAVLDSGRNISAIAAGPDGELYATDLAGSLLRLVVAP
jgi:glucose/arabinose dehydrogenase